MGMRVTEIKTKIELQDGKEVVVPELEENGREIERYSIEIPQAIEATEGTAAERQAAIDAYVAQELAKRDAK